MASWFGVLTGFLKARKEDLTREFSKTIDPRKQSASKEQFR